MEEDQDIPIILGQPFLAPGRTLIDVQKGKLTMRVQDEQVTFNVFKALKFPSEADCCFKIDIVDQQAEQTFEISHTKDPLEACLTKGELLDPEDEEIQEYTALLEVVSFIDQHGKKKVEEQGITLLRESEEKRLLRLNEMDEFCKEAYDNAKVYKERTKEWHDRRREFKPGLQVLLYNSCLRFFPGKLKSRWSGPFTVTKVFPYGAVEVSHDTKGTFKVN